MCVEAYENSLSLSYSSDMLIVLNIQHRSIFTELKFLWSSKILSA